jgi:hypothetical protein
MKLFKHFPPRLAIQKFSGTCTEADSLKIFRMHPGGFQKVFVRLFKGWLAHGRGGCKLRMCQCVEVVCSQLYSS